MFGFRAHRLQQKNAVADGAGLAPGPGLGCGDATRRRTYTEECAARHMPEALALRV